MSPPYPSSPKMTEEAVTGGPCSPHPPIPGGGRAPENQLSKTQVCHGQSLSNSCPGGSWALRGPAKLSPPEAAGCSRDWNSLVALQPQVPGGWSGWRRQSSHGSQTESPALRRSADCVRPRAREPEIINKAITSVLRPHLPGATQAPEALTPTILSESLK